MTLLNNLDLIRAFDGLPLVVLGDLVADEYIHGITSRISREAPVLIVAERWREVRCGAAANVVANLRALGASPRPVGLVGDDESGRALQKAFVDQGIDCDGVMVEAGRFTTTKTRVLAGGRHTVRQQMLRIDRLNSLPIAASDQDLLLGRLAKALEGASALVVSDYDEGVLDGPVLERVFELAHEAALPIFVDSRFRIETYRGVSTLTPNEPELERAWGQEIRSKSDLEQAGRWLLENSDVGSVLLKRGRRGMCLFERKLPTVAVPAFGSEEVADVTGAGDTVLATWSLARAAGGKAGQALELANIAGGLQVTKVGTAVVKQEELLSAHGGQV